MMKALLSVTILKQLPVKSTTFSTLKRKKRKTTNRKRSANAKRKSLLACKGMTNKAIADKLYLSIHTVITHRRNIARKLQIHSPAGLTIYAIVNKLVELQDIKDSL